MKRLLIGLVVWAGVLSVSGYRPVHPFAPAAHVAGTTAIHMSSNSIVAWADAYANVQYGADVDTVWKTPSLALGPAAGDSMDIVCLGRGGQITMSFAQGITDGPGDDFAIFENSFSPFYLELAWVEVSSDGTNFVRFPNYSYTPETAGEYIDSRDVHGLAGKYRQGYGAPFDLAVLQQVDDAITAGGHALSNEYVSAFSAAYPHLDTGNIKFVRLIDIIGDGSQKDAEGFPIYDPVGNPGSPGFDLDAVAVLNQSAPEGLPQTISFDVIPHQRRDFQSLELSGTSDSGLPLVYTIQSGPASITNSTLYFLATGTVEVVSSQPGNATYAPAVPVLRSFRVAEEIQHIFVEQVPNQIRGGADVQLRAYSSAGLPVEVHATAAPDSVVVLSNQVMQLGNEAGAVILRAAQPGNASVAPAEDILVQFEIVEPGASNAPVALSTWLVSNPVPAPSIAAEADAFGRPAVELEYSLDRTAKAWGRVMESSDLINWTHAVPEIIEQHIIGDVVRIKVRLSADQANSFHRLELEEL